MIQDNLKKYIQSARIQGDELFSDIQTYLEEEYRKRGKTFRRTSPFGMILRVVINLFELVMYYLEDAVTESNINTARKSNTIQGLAAITGHNPQRRIPASGSLEFTFNSGKNDGITNNKLIIPDSTRIRSLDNSMIYTLQLGVDNLELDVSTIKTGSFSSNVIQGEFKTQTFTGNGKKLQSFSITDNSIAHNQISVVINGVEYVQYQSLYDMQSGEPAYLIKSNFDGGIDIIFGNGNFGNRPSAGNNIQVTYLSTSGKHGELPESNNWEWVDSGQNTVGDDVDLTDRFTISVKDPIIFGSEQESIEFTRLIAPKKSSSFALINADNYVAFLRRFDYFRHVDVFTPDTESDLDNLVELFLLPDIDRRLGETQNYFTLNEDQFILTEYEENKIRNYLNLRGTQAPHLDIQFITPKIKRYAIDVLVRSFQGEEKNVMQQIETEISNYFINNTRQDYVPSSDLVYMFERIDGLDSVNVFFISEENERKLIKEDSIDSKTGKTVGLDQMNDITIEKGELPIIRGGWKDRFGQEYSKAGIKELTFEDLQSDTPVKKGAVNIFFQPSVRKTMNAELTQKYLNQ